MNTWHSVLMDVWSALSSHVSRAWRMLAITLALGGAIILVPLTELQALDVGGPITTNTIWTKANSPYIVTSDINIGAPVDDGTTVTLTIEAGVDVRFQAGTGLSIGDHERWPDQYQGALVALGGESEDDRITFTSNVVPQTRGDWTGIRFGRDTDSDRSVLHAVTVEYGGGGTSWRSANISVHTASPIIRHSIIRDSARYGISVEYASEMTLTGNTIHENLYEGIFVGGSSLVTLRDNVITKNDSAGGGGGGCGIVVENSSDVTLSENTITNNFYNGIAVRSSSGVTIQPNNTITENEGDGIIWEGSSGRIEANAITGNTGRGISLGWNSTETTITGNTIHENAYEGVYANTVSALAIHDNVISRNDSAGGDGGGCGLMVDYSSDLLITGNTITQNFQQGVSIRWSSAVTLSGNTLTENYGEGLLLWQSPSTISDNDFTNNVGAPIRADIQSLATIKGNTGTGNGQNLIELQGGTIMSEAIWGANGLPYLVTGDVRVRAADPADPPVVLTIEPGANLYFRSGTSLQIGENSRAGVLAAYGTAALPISFSVDPAQGGSAYWGGLRFEWEAEGSPSRLQFCHIDSAVTGIVIEENAAPIIDQCLLEQHRDYGIEFPEIWCEGDTCLTRSAEVTANTFAHNGMAAIRMPAANVHRIVDNSGTDGPYDYIEVYGDTIRFDSVWMNNDPSLPYVVTTELGIYNDNWGSDIVPSLTIAPGTIIRFAGEYSGLSAGRFLYTEMGEESSPGVVSAQGTADEPIIFTSFAGTPAPGDWQGITLSGQASSILDYCQIRFAGGENWEGAAALRILDESASQISNTTIDESREYGILVRNALPLIRQTTIRNSGKAGMYGDNSCEFWGCSPIHSDESPILIRENVINGSGEAAISVDPNLVKHLGDNQGTGNTENVIVIREGEANTTALWSAQDETSLSYVIAGEVTVCDEDGSSGTATLVLEPGFRLAFARGSGLMIGKNDGWEYYGALSAVGTASRPITLTSHEPSPQPGDWQGIQFRGPAARESVIEHCLIEYGGEGDQGNLVLDRTSAVTISSNTIRNSSAAGIYARGSDSNGAELSCNNLKDNEYGIFLTNQAAPQIVKNNFLTSRSSYGVYNSSSGISVNVQGNWWGDPEGPNRTGDASYGISPQDYAGWLTQESDCLSAPPSNSPPFVPTAPEPENGAVKVELDGEILSFRWIGGDPNPWDTVTYELRLGSSPETLQSVANNLTNSVYQHGPLDRGVRYVWQVIASDNRGQSTAGEIWEMTTKGGPPDVVVIDIQWNPVPPVEAGTTMMAAATVSNIGPGPVVDPFSVALQGEAEGGKAFSRSETMEEALYPNETRTITFYEWVAQTGIYAVSIEADSRSEIVETEEENNHYAAPVLLTVVDTTPPLLRSTVPVDGSLEHDVRELLVRLDDPYGVIAGEAVTDSVQVLRTTPEHVQETVSGSSVWEAGDRRIVFTPEQIPLPDGMYQVSLTAVDIAGNTVSYDFSFTVDGLAPVSPTITGGAVMSGLLQPQPVSNQSNSSSVTLTGIREDETSVWVNGVQRVNLGSGEWTVPLSLAQGNNTLTVESEDHAGNRSEPMLVDITVDSVAPIVTAINPANDSLLNTVPASVIVDVQDVTSGLDHEQSLFSLTDGAGTDVQGVWDHSTPAHAVFTPAALFDDDVYTLELRLVDQFGNADSVRQYQFTVDTTPPAAPTISNPFDGTSTSNPNVTISGMKEPNVAILRVDGSPEIQIIGHSASSDWQYSVVLEPGLNNFTFKARDQAGNESGTVTLSLEFNDTPPPPLTTLSVDSTGIGTQAALDWSAYNETLYGDIVSYEIYVDSEIFTDLTGRTPQRTVAAGTFRTIIDSLTRNTSYWFAVVPLDAGGQRPESIQVVEATLSDVVPPDEVANLQVHCFENRLRFYWTPSVNSHGDFARYLITFDGNVTEVTEMTSDEFEAAGLLPASSYDLTIRVSDESGNVSPGVTREGITWLDNPANLTVVDEQSGYVTISWQAIPADQLPHLDHYAVYVSDTAFSSVEGMTPRMTTRETSISVSGLVNDVTYHLAVTAVNTANGERREVGPVQATPVPDEQGPEFSSLQVDGVPLTDGHIITASVKFTAEASDATGVNWVKFLIDNELVRTDYSGSPNYYAFWDIIPVEDGPHTLTITASDTLENETTVSYTLNVALAAPPAPLISQPADGTLTNHTTIEVSGTAVQDAEVILYHNDVAVAEPIPVDAQGRFSTSVDLIEGENRLQASARYRSDEALSSPLSETVVVTVDTSLPQPPTNLSATTREGGEIKLSWSAPAAADIEGCQLYRATSVFTDPADAELVNPDSLLIGTSYIDLPATDGEYIYRLISVSQADNDSELSDAVVALSDRTPPTAELSYSTDPHSPPLVGGAGGGGIFAPGTVELILTVSEPLQSTPFLSITPENGFPISIELTRSAGILPAQYTGSFDIEDTTPSGIAYAIFSARDLAGNRGTEMLSGESLEIDTDGPAVTRLEVQPEHPLHNDAANPISVTVTMGLDETIKESETPTLSYLLSGPNREAIVISGLTGILPTEGEDIQTWQATFTLPADAGTGSAVLSGDEGLPAETLSFLYEGIDDLDNISERILTENLFQIYQGDLPPLEAPDDLVAQSFAGGKIQLTWSPVEEAIGYRVYRQTPGENELTLYQECNAALTSCSSAFLLLDDMTTFLDGESVPLTDGTYRYAVASLRQANGQESVSDISSLVEIVSDATSPAAPQNLTVEAVPQGISLQWEDAINVEPVTYRLYRAAGTEILSVDGLAPIIPEIPVDYLDSGVVDPNPSSDEPCYVVTAVDEIGNESLPSNSAYHNVGLLPVTDLRVRQEDEEPPVVSWDHPSKHSLAGYTLEIDQGRLTTPVFPEQSYTDTGYTPGSDRFYSIMAVDVNDVSSQGHDITLPSLRFTFHVSHLKRGIMNRLEYEIMNFSSERVSSARLNVQVESYAHVSETFSLEPEETKIVPVTIGGYADLPDLAQLVTTLEIRPNLGETVEITRTAEIEVGDGMLVAQILNEEFTRGATGTISFTLENTGDEEIEILTASEASSSPDIFWELVDGDDNVLSSAGFVQTLGEYLVTLANGKTVARIPAGGIFSSDPVEMSVPLSATNDVTLRLWIVKIYAHYGTAEQVTMTGLTATQPVNLRDTAYYGRCSASARSSPMAMKRSPSPLGRSIEVAANPSRKCRSPLSFRSLGLIAATLC